MRKALIVGINYYEHCGHLRGCVSDALSVSQVLDRHEDGSKNFDIKELISTDVNSKVIKRNLKDSILELFNGDSEIAFLYFSGHGHVESDTGYLVTSECKDGDDGVSLEEVLKAANESKAKNKILVLDSCFAGAAGNIASLGDKALLSEGMTILTASSKDQYALEHNGSGVFTKLFVDALSGGAANLLGEITPGSIYAHIDQSLGSWEQRPIFKTNVKRFTSLRKVKAPISLTDLKMISSLFSAPDIDFALDPSFEPQPPAPNHGIQPDPENNKKFAILQKLNRLNLVKPVGEEHMYFAAMNSKSCRLTALGEHYWKLITSNKI
ncbi:MAG: caspase family protein [Proteobacteria bacterium]|nr:caspase family protein [Pseudomonadota bacterium]